MRRNREGARPAVGAARRAMDRDANHRESSLSVSNCTTSSTEGQIFRIADLLLKGEENALPMKHLRSVTGRSSRELRALIQQERLEGAAICSNNATGYYISATDEERERFIRSMRHRSAEIARVADAVEQAEV